MAQILDMPQLSDTMKIGVLQKWRKNEGDTVAPGEILAEVETDKAVMDFEAFDQGVLLKRLIGDGTSVPVGTPIAIIGKAGDDISKLLEEAKSRGAAAPPNRRQRPGAGRQARACERRRPRRPAKPSGGARERSAARPTAPPRPAPPRPERAADRPAGKVLASPLARRLATDLGVDLRTVQRQRPRRADRRARREGCGRGWRRGRPARVDWHAAEEAPGTLARHGGRAACVGRRPPPRPAGPRAPHRGPPAPRRRRRATWSSRSR